MRAQGYQFMKGVGTARPQFYCLRDPEPHTGIEGERGIDVGPLSLALSPSKGERVPARAGEGSLSGPFHFLGSGFVCLGAARNRRRGRPRPGASDVL